MTDEKSFKHLNDWKAEFNNCCQTRNNKKEVPFLIAGNKVDKISDRKISKEQIEHWCKNNGGIPYFETSAKDFTGVNELFEEAARIGYRSKIEHT